MRPLFQKAETAFTIFIALCVVTAIGLYLFEITLKAGEYPYQIVVSLHAWLAWILIADLAVNLARAYPNRQYIRHNWRLIFSYLPIIRILMLTRFRSLLHAYRICRTHPGCTIAHHQGIRESLHSMSNSLKPGKLDWGILSGKTVIVNLFISPAADRLVAKGIQEGISHFLNEKVPIKPLFTRQDWIKAHTVEQTLLKGWHIDAADYTSLLSEKLDRIGMNIFITDQEISFKATLTEFSSFLKKNSQSTYYLFSTKGLLSFSDSYPVEIWKQKELRGFIVGYHTLAKRYEHNFKASGCTEQFCLHKDVNRRNLDLHSFMYFLNRRKPICDAHCPF